VRHHVQPDYSSFPTMSYESSGTATDAKSFRTSNQTTKALWEKKKEESGTKGSTLDKPKAVAEVEIQVGNNFPPETEGGNSSGASCAT
jgi:hypothetical protein